MKTSAQRFFAVLFVFHGVLGASIFTYADNQTEEEWLKQRVVAIHAKYTAPGDHDVFLQKLKKAQEAIKSYPARQVLDQVIVRREELKPKNIGNGVSSITEEPKNEQSPEEEIKNTDQPQSTYQLTNGTINITTLQNTWLGWLNDLRAQRGLAAMTLEPVLHKTAAEWSETMKKKGVADHRRFAKSAYYAYRELEERFSSRGVEFVNVSRATFTENIGRATFRCKKADCTSEAIDAMRQTWNFYLSEEGKANDAHRRTITHPLFTIVGLGIAVDESVGKFFVTTHYGTEVE